MDEKVAIQELVKKGILPTPDRVKELIASRKPAPAEVVSIIKNKTNTESRVEVLRNYKYLPRKFTANDFAAYQRGKHSALKDLLLKRAEVQNAVSIARVTEYVGKDKAIIIGMVSNISNLPKGSIKLELEDPSGSINAIISAKRTELLEEARDIMLDEVLAFKGSASRDTFFVEELIWPDIPARPIRTTEEDIYVAFAGDIHIGSKEFVPNSLQKFVDWLNGKVGDSKQQEIAKKTKYVLFSGDLADGIGIYPGQDKDLNIKDIYQQYNEVAKYLSQIPTDKNIIIFPGNHDAMRLAEPQPMLPKDIAAPLWELPNVVMVSNPSTVRIHNLGNFSGQDILLYHGMSYDYYINNNNMLRNADSYSVPSNVAKFLLKRRHLSPTQGSNPKLPLRTDPLVIRETPDIFVSGHIHKASVDKYKNTLIVATSCFQDQTAFQEKFGHCPDPGVVPVLNLRTREIIMMTFK